MTKLRKRHSALETDCGADPSYVLGDLAKLLRLARIDLGVEVKVIRDFSRWPDLGRVFGPPEAFRRIEEPSEQPLPCALLLKASRPAQPDCPTTWIVVLKPCVPMQAPADIRRYAREHPTFPQESVLR